MHRKFEKKLVNSYKKMKFKAVEWIFNKINRSVTLEKCLIHKSFI